MHVITTRNVHSALPDALKLLDDCGIERYSRNGKVRMAPWPVTTVFERPMERVIFWPERDANPFFHLYEALWMLAGRNDVKPLLRYSKQMERYSDDGNTLHGAYGYRWRRGAFDQLVVIAKQLQKNPNDRRCVLQMWDTDKDLGRVGKDVPCNTMATFQINDKGELETAVFNRSNDIIWGAYGANAVHFSFLQEYLAIWIGCPIGPYRQISVNWHAYLEQGDAEPLAQVKNVPRFVVQLDQNPYTNGKAKWLPMLVNATGDKAAAQIDTFTQQLLMEADAGFPRQHKYTNEPFFDVAYHVLYAHHCFKTFEPPFRYGRALAVLEQVDANIDWKVAAREWIQRRYTAWEAKQ